MYPGFARPHVTRASRRSPSGSRRSPAPRRATPAASPRASSRCADACPSVEQAHPRRHRRPARLRARAGRVPREIIAMKKRRRVALGTSSRSCSRTATPMRFQIQEMARAERMLTDEAIQTELDIYNPLIPEAGQLSATLFVELTTEAELRGVAPQARGHRALCGAAGRRGGRGCRGDGRAGRPGGRPRGAA